MRKFYGTYQELQNRVAMIGVGGMWRDLGNQKQYRAHSGAILNWWSTTMSVTFQGSPVSAVERLKAGFAVAINYVPQSSEATLERNGFVKTSVRQIIERRSPLGDGT